MIEKKRREDLNKLRKDDMPAYNIDVFEQFYRRQLRKDAQRDPRPIVPEEYQKKKIVDPQPYLTYQERKASYYKDFELYKENKSKCKDLVDTLFRGPTRQNQGILHTGVILGKGEVEPRPNE